MQKVIIMNDIYFWGILASITGIAIMFSVIKHKKSVSTIKNGTYLIFSILMICLGITTILFKRYDSIWAQERLSVDKTTSPNQIS